MSDNSLWDEHAQWWIDGFTNGADPEYEEQIIPLAVEELSGFGAVLDVGCGDGQIARALARTGCTVTGIDPTERNLEVARERGGGPTYINAGATDLPFEDSSFDAVVACLVFEHIDDVDGAIAEVARVLRPGGRFSFFLNHPLLQTPGSGWIDDFILDPPEQYWRIGPYLVETESIEEVELGVHIRFLHRPLSLRQCAHLARVVPRSHGRAGTSPGLSRSCTRVPARTDSSASPVPADDEAVAPGR